MKRITMAMRWTVMALVCSASLSAEVLPAQAVHRNCKPFGSKEPRIIGCTLTADDTVFSRPMPVGSLLHFDSAGTYKYFEFRKPTVYEKLLLAGGDDGPHHSVFPDGAPKIFWLETVQEIQGVPCRPMRVWTEIIGHSSEVLFHRNGKLKACRVGRALSLQGRSVEKGDRVEFDSAGLLIAPARR